MAISFMTQRYPSIAVPSKQAGAFYACYFGVLGVMLPFLGPFLAARGLGAVAVGLVTAAFSLAKLGYAPFLGSWIDRGRWFPGLLGVHMASPSRPGWSSSGQPMAGSSGGVSGDGSRLRHDVATRRGGGSGTTTAPRVRVRPVVGIGGVHHRRRGVGRRSWWRSVRSLSVALLVSLVVLGLIALDPRGRSSTQADLGSGDRSAARYGPFSPF